MGNDEEGESNWCFTRLMEISLRWDDMIQILFKDMGGRSKAMGPWMDNNLAPDGWCSYWGTGGGSGGWIGPWYYAIDGYLFFFTGLRVELTS